MFIYTALLKTAEHLSDAYGEKAYHYDLGIDLDNLWQESKNVLKATEVPRPKLRQAPNCVEYNEDGEALKGPGFSM